MPFLGQTLKGPAVTVKGYLCRSRDLLKRIIIQAILGKKRDPISKITRAKRTRVLAVEYLASKCQI
jgi:hypothetical protein